MGFLTHSKFAAGAVVRIGPRRSDGLCETEVSFPARGHEQVVAVDLPADRFCVGQRVMVEYDLPMNPDHGTGRQVADYLSTLPPVCPVIVHTSNEFFAPGMMRVLTEGGWPVARVYPHDDHNWVRWGWTEQIREFIRAGWISP